MSVDTCEDSIVSAADQESPPECRRMSSLSGEPVAHVNDGFLHEKESSPVMITETPDQKLGDMMMATKINPDIKTKPSWSFKPLSLSSKWKSKRHKQDFELPDEKSTNLEVCDEQQDIMHECDFSPKRVSYSSMTF